MSQLNTRVTNVEFDTPANRIISQFQPKNKFRIDTSLPDLAFLRQLSVQGRMRYFAGTGRSSGASPISFIPNIGETFFAVGGYYSGQSASALSITVSNDGNTRTRLTFPSAVAFFGTFDFGIDSLVGDNIKAFTVSATAVNQSDFTLWGWVENTSRIRDVTT